jgi:hypothetical protein
MRLTLEEANEMYREFYREAALLLCRKKSESQTIVKPISIGLFGKT